MTRDQLGCLLRGAHPEIAFVDLYEDLGVVRAVVTGHYLNPVSPEALTAARRVLEDVLPLCSYVAVETIAAAPQPIKINFKVKFAGVECPPGPIPTRKILYPRINGIVKYPGECPCGISARDYTYHADLTVEP